MAQTLLEAWRAFRDERSVTLSPSTLSTDYRSVERYLERCPVQNLEQGRAALTWVLKEAPPNTGLRVSGLLKTLYRWAAAPDVALVSHNPVASFKLPKRPTRHEEVQVIPNNEIPLVLAALSRRLRKGIRPPWHKIAEYMLQTGMRTGEAFATHVDDVQGDRVLVHANHTVYHGLKTTTKTGRKRWVPLNEVALGILGELQPGPDGRFFPWSRTAFQSFFSDRMQKVHNRGIIGALYRPYDLRHTAISRWLEAGVPVATAASWAGNSSGVIWAHYAGSSNDYEMPVL